MRHPLKLPVGLAFLALAASQVNAQEGGQEKYATKEEYDKVRKDLETMKTQLQELKKKGASEQELQQQIDELEKELKATKAKVQDQKPGETRFLLTGYGFAGFTARERENSTFSAGVNPIFLWKPTDRILFEAELEVELEGAPGDTHVGLEYAQLSYLLNDYVTIGAGRFLTPFGTFDERLHPKWINKLPDRPLAFDDGGISPEATLGLEVRGGIPVEPVKLNYSIYVGNSPRLETDPTSPATFPDVGKLFDDNFSGLTHTKTVGGRIGLLPIPELEVGYSILFGRVGEGGAFLSNNVDALLQGIDVSYVRETDLLKGTVTVFGQWAWSHVDRVTYDPTGLALTFQNRRQGGYLQLSYRPSKIDVEVLKNLEIVGRYDVLNKPHDAPDNIDERRWTLGLDYWVTPSMVVKVAYQWDKKDDPARVERNVNAFLAQFALGF